MPALLEILFMAKRKRMEEHLLCVCVCVCENEVEKTFKPLLFQTGTLILSATKSEGLLHNRSEHASQLGPQSKAVSRIGN
jgi:hypothetical protein